MIDSEPPPKRKSRPGHEEEQAQTFFPFENLAGLDRSTVYEAVRWEVSYAASHLPNFGNLAIFWQMFANIWPDFGCIRIVFASMDACIIFQDLQNHLTELMMVNGIHVAKNIRLKQRLHFSIRDFNSSDTPRPLSSARLQGQMRSRTTTISTNSIL